MVGGRWQTLALGVAAAMCAACDGSPESAVDAAAYDAAIVFDAASVDAGFPDASGAADAPLPDAAPVEDCPLDGGPLPAPAPVRLSADTTGYGPTIGRVRLTADGARVVYTGDFDVEGVQRLYSVPIGGGTITTLSQNLTSDASLDVIRFSLSADGEWAAFVGDPEVDGSVRAFGVATTGGAVTALSPDTGDPTRAVLDALVSADAGGTVVYRGDLETDGVERLYSAPIGGGGTTTLSHAGTSLGDIPSLLQFGYRLSPNGARVVYVGTTEDDGVRRLYSVPVGGGTIATLSQNLAADTGRQALRFHISPDSTRVVFTGDTEIDGVVRLYSVPIEGGAVVTLSQNTGIDSAKSVCGEPRISPDSSTVVFTGDTEVDGVFRLYSVPIDGGAVATLSHNTGSDTRLSAGCLPDHPEPGGDVFALSGAQVVFSGDTEWPDVLRLYSTSVAGGDPVTLSQNTGVNTALTAELWSISPAGDRVAFSGDTEIEDVRRVYSVPVTGGLVRTLSTNTGTDTTLGAGSPRFADEGTVVFSGDTEVDGVFRVYRVNACGGLTTILSQNTGSDPALDVTEFFVSATGQYVVFVGDVEVDGISHIYSRGLR